MKKLITLILVFVMLPITAFASSADMLAEVLKNSQSITSAHTTMQEQVKLNRPLEIFECIPNFDLGNTDIDLAMLADSVASAKSTIDMSYNLSDDLKKGDISMQMEFDTPIRFNDSFTLTAWTKIGLWVTYDLTNEGNYMFKVIADIPFMKKYQVLDMSEYFNENPSYVKLVDKALAEAVNDSAAKALIGNADLRKVGNRYTLSFTDEGAKAYILEILELSKQYAKDDREEKLFDSLINNANDFFTKTTLLGEEGMTFEIEVNSRGYITAQNVSMNIALNVYDILEAYSKNTEGLDREKSYIDITASAAFEMSGHNKTTVDIPEITEENANITEYFDTNPSIEYGRTILYENPIFENNTVYYPLNEIDEKSKIEVTKDGDIVTIYDYASNVTITASLTDNKVFINDNEQESDVANVIERDGKLYALQDILLLANIDIYASFYSFEDESFVTAFEYTEIFEDPNEAVAEDDEYQYIPPSLYYYLNLNRPLYIKNSAAYMPIYEFLQSICDYSGEFTFPENGLVFTTDTENVLGIKDFSAYIGDAFVTINGEQKPLDGYVEVYEGIMQIPVSFADESGFSSHISMHYTRGLFQGYSLYLEIENPEYEGNVDNYYHTYIPETLNYYVNSDRVPHMQDGVMYMPVYDFLKELFEGEFTFYENGFEYVASGENDFGISKVTVYTGDNFVTADDEKIELEGSVISVDDVMRVPVSFANSLGLTTENISVYYGTTYTFSKPNPDYTGNPYGDDPTYNNWWYSLIW